MRMERRHAMVGLSERLPFLQSRFVLTQEVVSYIQEGVLNVYRRTNPLVDDTNKARKEASAPDALEEILGEMAQLQRDNPRLFRGLMAALSQVHSYDPGRFNDDYRAAVDQARQRSVINNFNPGGVPDLQRFAASCYTQRREGRE